MNFQFYVEKLKNSSDFKKFAKENKEAFLCGCFFIVDKEEGKDKQHFDFYVPSLNKIFSFPLENGTEKTETEVKEDRVPTKISMEHGFNFEDIEGMILKKMEEEKVDKKIQKMLFSLQNVEGKDVFVGTIFITGLGLISTTIDLEKMEMRDFKKKSFFDIMNILKKDK